MRKNIICMYDKKGKFKMKLSEVKEILKAEVLTGEEFLDKEVQKS